MQPATPLLAVVVYVWVYYAAARSAMRQLREADPSYDAYLGGNPGIGMSNALAILRMLFDGGVPKPFYPRGVVRRIVLARWMFYLYPVVLICARTFSLTAS